MVAHCWRFRDEVIALRDRIAAGDLGEVVKTRGYGVHANWGPEGWFTDPDLAGGGALPDMGVHAIDTARFLLGDPEPGARLRGGRHPVRAGPVHRRRRRHPADRLVQRHELDRGVGLVAAPRWAASRPTPRSTAPAGTRGSGRPRIPARATSTCSQPMYSAQVAEFLDAIAEGRPPRPSGEDGRVVIEVVERAYASAREDART